MNVIIAGDAFGFPNGMGATSRVNTYAQGFLENGASVKVLCLTPTEPRKGPIINTQARGNYNGIDFEYTYGSTTTCPSFVKRRWMQLIKPLLFLKAVWAEDKKWHIDALILFSNSLVNMMIAFLVTRFLHISYVQEKSELPFAYRKKTPCMKLYAWLFTSIMYKLPDGIIVISKYLESYFASRIRRRARLIRVPILVNTERFADIVASPLSHRSYVAYTGSLVASKGVDNLIHAFATIAEDFPNTDLWVSGSTNSTSMAKDLKKLANSLGIGRRVRFVGTVPFHDYPALLSGALLLVVPHRVGEFSAAAFPTKIGEYLASGTPVVSTCVGELVEYLTDGVNAYLVPPDNINAFAKQMQFVLTHPDEAQNVGIGGKTVAIKHFEYRTQTKRLLAEIGKLKER